jgi:hypothetical protein
MAGSGELVIGAVIDMIALSWRYYDHPFIWLGIHGNT